jgi:hypothetical protein
MKTKALLFLSLFYGLSFSYSNELAPSLHLSDAARIIENALKDAELPSDHFLRTVQLRKTDDGTWIYFAFYTPPERRKVLAEGEEPKPIIHKYLTVSMGGNVTFEEDVRTPAVSPRRRVIDQGGVSQ